MDQAHKLLIRRNLMTLSDNLRSDIDLVTKYLFQESILSQHMQEDILYQRTPSDKAFKLLDMIPNRGPKAFKKFYEATVKLQLWEVADLLEPSRKAFHNSSPKPKSPTRITSLEEEKEDSLPDDWPNIDHLHNVNSLNLKIKKVQPHQSAMLNYFHNPREDIFKMNFKHKGKVLVLENIEFEHGLEYRTGSEMDSKGLNVLFQGFGFDVTCFVNKNKKEMVNILEKEFSFDYSNYGCYILFILSHGREGEVYATDTKLESKLNFSAALQLGVQTKPEMETNDTIKIAWIEQKFHEVKTLIGKPKLLFIQACQGSESNLGHDHPPPRNDSYQESSQASTNSSAHMEIGSAISDNITEETREPTNYTNDMNVDLGVDKYATDSVDGKPGKRRGKKTDVMVFYSTTPGNLSLRNTKFGTWFIQAVIYVFANFAYKDELSELLRKVKKLVSKSRAENLGMQTSVTKNSIYDRFYFFPGLSNDSN